MSIIIDRLNQLHSVTSLVKRKIIELETLGLSVNPSVDLSSDRLDLCDDIRKQLLLLQDTFTKIQLEVEDVIDINERLDYEVKLDELEEFIGDLRQEFRKATLQSKKNEVLKIERERFLLFAPQKIKKETIEGKNTSNSDDLFEYLTINRSGTGLENALEDRLLRKTEAVTDTLKRSHTLMQGELAKSSLNVEALDESTKNLQMLEQKYTALDIITRGSQKLISHIEQADLWDKRMMIGSLSFLAACVSWVIWCRVLKWPVTWALWTMFRGFRVFRYFFVLIFGKEAVSSIDASSIASSIDVLSSETVLTQTQTQTHTITEMLTETLTRAHDEL